ncbi:MAG: hypothetical protein Kow00108_10850 [Calditrichia bacterium]
MKLYMVHCGFYLAEPGEGAFENHTNFFIAAESFKDAKRKVKQLEQFKKFNMHVDGMVEVESVDGYTIQLVPDDTAKLKTVSKGYDELNS